MMLWAVRIDVRVVAVVHVFDQACCLGEGAGACACYASEYVGRVGRLAGRASPWDVTWPYLTGWRRHLCESMF